MGMYDTFLTNNEFQCPNCNHDMIIMNGIQSKSFECLLEVYEKGDMVLDEQNDLCIMEFEWCANCNSKVTIYLAFYKGIYIESFQYPQEVDKAIKGFDILSLYRKQYKEKSKYKNAFNSIKSNLDALIKFRAKKHKNTSLAFLSISITDVLDYNIIKTLENILNKFKDLN